MAKTPAVKKAAQPAAASTESSTDIVVEKLIVVAKVDGFRRAGRAWSAEATEVSADDLTEEQIEALLSEPALTVTVVGAESK